MNLTVKQLLAMQARWLDFYSQGLTPRQAADLRRNIESKNPPDLDLVARPDPFSPRAQAIPLADEIEAERARLVG